MVLVVFISCGFCTVVGLIILVMFITCGLCSVMTFITYAFGVANIHVDFVISYLYCSGVSGLGIHLGCGAGCYNWWCSSFGVHIGLWC